MFDINKKVEDSKDYCTHLDAFKLGTKYKISE